ncbi:MAG: hypothetical protein HC927_00985 [Deltaproteobacteria bacterium]|nr:hypothetical protein [Deltaproteobacteria bacterium]
MTRESKAKMPVRPISRLHAALLVTLLQAGAVSLANIYLEALTTSESDEYTVMFSAFMGLLWLVTILVLAFGKRNAAETANVQDRESRL